MSIYSKYFRTQDFRSGAPSGTSIPYMETSTRFEVDENSRSVMIQTNTTKRRVHEDMYQTSWIRFELEDWNQLENLRDFVKNQRQKGSTVQSKKHLSVVNCESYDSRNNQKESTISQVNVTANDERMVFYGGCPNSPVINFSKTMIDNEAQDEENIDRLEDFLEDLCNDTDSPILDDIIDSEIRAKLNSIHYGDEVIQHIEDGNKCFENELFQPALSSYIHAIEWTMIAYLEDQEGIDIIQKESNGTYYQFAGGKHNLLDKVTDNVDLDQKTVSKIESMNQAERRWAAHHKSGNTLPIEIRAIRARLKKLSTELFA